MRLVFGQPYADRHGLPFIDPREEQVNFTDGTSDHLFECFAMANLLLCSAVAKAGGQASRGTAVMRNNCARHLVATIDILQPTLVISQGLDTGRHALGFVGRDTRSRPAPRWLLSHVLQSRRRQVCVGCAETPYAPVALSHSALFRRNGRTRSQRSPEAGACARAAVPSCRLARSAVMTSRVLNSAPGRGSRRGRTPHSVLRTDH